MFEVNQTEVVEILLLGFQNTQTVNSLLFALFLVIYILTIVWNLLIIISVTKYPRLKSPMYFFLTQLSMCDILVITVIVPNMLHVINNGGSSLSVTGCIAQFSFYCLTESTECFLLTVMSYDRYLAICHPLHYNSIMSVRLCFQLIGLACLLACLFTCILSPLVLALCFCGQVIDHYFCDLGPLLELSCTKHPLVERIHFFLDIPFVIAPFCFIIFTYASIFIAVLRINSNIGRQKAFSTCSAHLTVVCTYYGTLIIVYMTPSKGVSFNISKILSLLFTVLCPFFNPIIYSLRNEQIKIHLNKFIFRCLKKI